MAIRPDKPRHDGQQNEVSPGDGAVVGGSSRSGSRIGDPETPRSSPPGGSTAKRRGLESFWSELAEMVGPDFSGNVVLHCSEGTIRKYEVHKMGRPRGGSVLL